MDDGELDTDQLLIQESGQAEVMALNAPVACAAQHTLHKSIAPLLQTKEARASLLWKKVSRLILKPVPSPCAVTSKYF